jgi:hypothetical protein
MRNYSRVMRWACLMAVSAVIGSACGDPSSAGSSSQSAPLAGTPAAASACPDVDASLLDFDADPGAMTAESARLEPMLGQVLAYGSAHPDEFAGYGLTWHTASDASVIISLTGDLEAHRAALSQIVALPDELIVCSAVQSQSAAQALLAELQAEFGDRFLTSGASMRGTVDLAMPAADEQLAGQLVAQFGPKVRVKVGSLPYPMPDPPPPSHCPELVADEPPAGLEVTVVAPTRPLSTAADPFASDLQVQVRNVGTDPVRFDTGIAIGYLLDDEGVIVASSETVMVPAIGLTVDLSGGQSTTVQLVVSPASCDPAVGYVVPPGTYQLVALLPRGTGALRSAPLTVDVTAS